MAFVSEPDFLVLHALRLKGFAEVDVIAEQTGLPQDEVTKFVDAFEVDRLVAYRGGRVSGWTLTAAGRVEDEKRAAAELDAAEARSAVEHAYDRFSARNAEVLQVCTDWQVRDTADGPVTNTHDDLEHDDGVIAQLVELDTSIQPVTEALGASLERFASYGPRLRHAVDRVQLGEKDWFSKPTIDSYHTVWFELHEDLLATLGIERGKETS